VADGGLGRQAEYHGELASGGFTVRTVAHYDNRTSLKTRDNLTQKPDTLCATEPDK
jgi:hypothetical protein